MFTDPEGAAFCVWRAKEHKGARIVNEPGVAAIPSGTVAQFGVNSAGALSPLSPFGEAKQQSTFTSSAGNAELGELNPSTRLWLRLPHAPAG